MTRLQPDDIGHIADRLSADDQKLLARTGRTLRGIACHAVQLKEEEIADRVARIRTAVVPISWGEGLIAGFSEATGAILQHLGFQTFVTRHMDVSGMAEAFEKGADIIFLSDDERFVALNAVCGRVVDNATATGKGFVAGLDLMAGGLKGKDVLVIGCGPVGFSAAMALAQYEARVSVHDLDTRRSEDLARELGKTLNRPVRIKSDLKSALSRHRLIVEATNSGGIIHEPDLAPGTYIAAPGMPLGLSWAATQKMSARLLHDPLQLGVATMGLEACKTILEKNAGSTPGPEMDDDGRKETG